MYDYSGTLVHLPLMGGLLHLVQRGGDWAGPQPAQAPPRCTKCNSPSHQLPVHVRITVLLYNGPLFCGFNVLIKGLNIPPSNVVPVQGSHMPIFKAGHFLRHCSIFRSISFLTPPMTQMTDAFPQECQE